MQHPKFEEGPLHDFQTRSGPQPDGKSALAIDPELNCNATSNAPDQQTARGAGVSVSRKERARWRSP